MPLSAYCHKYDSGYTSSGMYNTEKGLMQLTQVANLIQTFCCIIYAIIGILS